MDELEEELHTKTDQLLHAFSRQNELESEMSSVRKDQHTALENAAKLESDVCHYYFSVYANNIKLIYHAAFVKSCCSSICKG